MTLNTAVLSDIRAVREIRQLNIGNYATDCGCHERHAFEVLAADGWRAPTSPEELDYTINLLRPAVLRPTVKS